MTRRRLLAAGLTLAALTAAVFVARSDPASAQPDGQLPVILRLDFTGPAVQQERGSNRALVPTAVGKPKPVTEPVAAFEFTGPNDSVVVRKALSGDDTLLPKQDFTAAAWVRIDEPTEWGGIFGCFQDNRPKQAGFCLGYDQEVFQFSLATAATGKMTYLKGKTKYQVGRWYHVAATYDGATMRLFVNGVEDTSGKAQSGRVLYADSAPLVVARYQDADEDYPFQGAIREVLWSDRAADKEQIAAEFKTGEGLTKIDPKPASLRFEVSPYLQFGTRTSMTIMCETSEPTSCEVKYGTSTPPTQVAKSDKAGTMHEVKLDHLVPNTKYFYQAVCSTPDGKSVTSKLLTFGTAVDAADAFSFGVIGDTQRNPAATARVAKILWERRPNFVVHLGDVVDDGAAKWQWTGDLFKPCRELFGRVCVYPTIGNHEKNHAHYYKYFSLPKPEYYYSYTFGNAEFFSLDTNKPVDEKSEQYKWLDASLAKSTAKWKVCYHHHPCYSSDSDDYGDTWKGKSSFGAKQHKPLLALYEKHNVDLVMNGHIHLYERTHPIRAGKVDPKGVVHLTSGGGGGSLEDFDPVPAFFKNQQRVTYHGCYFTATGGRLECRVFDDDGRLFDQWELKKD